MSLYGKHPKARAMKRCACKFLRCRTDVAHQEILPYCYYSLACPEAVADILATPDGHVHVHRVRASPSFASLVLNSFRDPGVCHQSALCAHLPEPSEGPGQCKESQRAGMSRLNSKPV